MKMVVQAQRLSILNNHKEEGNGAFIFLFFREFGILMRDNTFVVTI